MVEYVPSEAQLRLLFESTKTIAVVGLSDNPARPSYDVAEYLRSQGYTIVPINPTIQEWHGLKAYPSLSAAKEAGITIDLVDVFRRPEDVGPIADEAVKVGAKAFWLQLGVINEDAANKAKDAGLLVAMDRCTKIEHRRVMR